jgi:hypothetical protein
LQLLLALASEVILGSESRGTPDHILLSQIGEFLFSPPTTRRATVEVFDLASTRDAPVQPCPFSRKHTNLVLLGTDHIENTLISIVT